MIRYKSKLNIEQTELGIKLVKEIFSKYLEKQLKLIRVSAPKFLKTKTGIQDDLAGTCESVKFKVPDINGDVELVHSLAKWKRISLHEYKIKKHHGIWTDMDAIRKDEHLDNIHSIYVDQYDWEMRIEKEDRNLEFLKKTVRKIYEAMRKTESEVNSQFGKLKKKLPKKITFLHTEDIVKEYPKLTSKERECLITEKYGAIFLIGIGFPIEDGKPHDLRAVDYDDWFTKTDDIHHGLNGDILVWDKVRHSVLELSSMGIRVNSDSLTAQMKMMNFTEQKFYHDLVLNNQIPLSIGGGIGQSRLAMFFLEKIHIGEVQVSEWPTQMIKKCEEDGIKLL
jgi:aspartate--ammonia ligase